ncbi:MAG: GGDEF domain-containing response regulator [Pseudomonadales bacterium]|nr:GGDEF domain-containing response regulator [Pseudomonadales bacterium]
MRAMIVEASKSLSVLLNQHLSELHFVTEVHTSGTLALSSIKSKDNIPVDLICVGLILTDMDGLSFTEKLMSLDVKDFDPHTRILLFTPEAERHEARALTLGVQGVYSASEIDLALDHLNTWSQNQRLERHEGNILVIEGKHSLDAKTTLSDYGYTLECVQFGIDGLAKLRGKEYELVIIHDRADIGMPSLELVQNIRNRKQHPLKLPILVVTDDIDESKNLKLIQSGANDFVLNRPASRECLARANSLVRNKILYDQVRFKYEKLHKIAMTDHLTGLYNRHYLFEMAPQKLAEARRHKFSVSLLIADLDKFKAINDNHGHDVGDKVLSAIGYLLKNTCREEDVVGRFGGEEFIIVLPYCDIHQAYEKANQIRLKVFELNPVGISISASFGVASFDAYDKSNFADLFKRADEAVFWAKDRGRNRVEVNSLA